jgi:hypothetical protein
MAMILNCEIQQNGKDIAAFESKLDELIGQEILALETIKKFQSKMEAKDIDIADLYEELLKDFQNCFGIGWQKLTQRKYDKLEAENENNAFWDFIVWNIKTMEDLLFCETAEGVFESDGGYTFQIGVDEDENDSEEECGVFSDDESKSDCLDALGHFIDFTEQYFEDLDGNIAAKIGKLKAGRGDELQCALGNLEIALQNCKKLMDKYPDHIVTY